MIIRKYLRITITGETYDDLVEALKEVRRKVEEQYISGSDSNETGDYDFNVTEEVY
jgi:methylase of polypeptide subunit release factors